MSPPTDAALLLRVHAEHEWLQDELLSLLDQLEEPAELCQGEMQAALAYLEVTWAEGIARADQTDAAYERWERRRGTAPECELGPEAGSYYRWLLTLRATVMLRAAPFTGAASAPALPSM